MDIQADSNRDTLSRAGIPSKEGTHRAMCRCRPLSLPTQQPMDHPVGTQQTLGAQDR